MSDVNCCVHGIAIRNFQSVSPSSWSVRIKHAPCFSVVRNKTTSDGIRSSLCITIRSPTVISLKKKGWHKMNIYTYELAIFWYPCRVNNSYCWLFISRSRKNRAKSSTASRTSVIVRTNIYKEKRLIFQIANRTNGPQYVIGVPIWIAGMNCVNAIMRK